MTAASIAPLVRSALDRADLEELGALLSPDVQWGAPDDPSPSCRNRGQVLRWFAQGRAAGRRATVTDVEVHGNALLVAVRLETGEQRWQVMRVGPDGVNDIRAYDDRSTAASQLGI